MATAIKHHVSDWVKPSFVIFDIRALWRSALSVRVPRCKKIANDGLTRSDTGCFNASGTHMVTVGVKGLTSQKHRLLYYCAQYVAPIFLIFLSAQIVLGAPLQSWAHITAPASRQVKFREVTPTNPEVIGMHTKGEE